MILAILAVQVLALTAGSLWLAHWERRTRFRQLAERVDAEADLVEDLVQAPDGVLAYERGTEVGRELDGEGHVYVLVTDADGRVVGESTGPSPATRSELRTRLSRERPEGERIETIVTSSGPWLVQIEPVARAQGGRSVRGAAFVGMNAQPVRQELAVFERYLALATLAMLAASSVGTWVVVSVTTRNLRRFAAGLREVRPPRFEGGGRSLVPASAEELLLFESYREMIAAVKASTEAQRLFIAHASHELKTPIAAAASALEVTLSRPRAAAEYEQTCRDVLGEVTVLKRLSSVLLDMAQLDREDLDRRSTGSCAIEAVLERVEQRFAKEAAKRGVELVVSRPACSSARLPGATEQWEVVLGNLVENGLKYGRAGGHVFVRVAVDAAGGVEVVVEDDGRGMSEADVARLGEVFFRADAARSGSGSFGLGFAHAKKLAARVGFEIEVRSALGRGTTLRVYAKDA